MRALFVRSPPRRTAHQSCTAVRGIGIRDLNGTRREETAVYAIVRAGAKQQKVAVGDVIEIDTVSTGVGESLTPVETCLLYTSPSPRDS